MLALALLPNLLYLSGAFALGLGLLHFAFPILFDFDGAIPRDGPPLRPFHLGPIRYPTTRGDVRGLAWVMNHAASFGLVTVGLLDVAWTLWWAEPWRGLALAWVAAWWALRAGSQLYLGRRRGDWLIVAGFASLAVLHAGLAFLPTTV
jgi:hypothetical protein